MRWTGSPGTSSVCEPATGLYRFMHISVFGGPVGVGHHIFVDGLDQKETEEAWESWLTKLFS